MQAIVTADGVDHVCETSTTRAAASRRAWWPTGSVKGDRVGLLAPNGIDWAVHALAVMRIGAVLVPLSTLLRPPELLAQLTTASVVAPDRRARVPRPPLPGRPARWRRPGWRRQSGCGGRHRGRAVAATALGARATSPSAPCEPALVGALEARVRPADDLVVLFTSGSRGAPKGVIHTHGAALRATAASLGGSLHSAG